MATPPQILLTLIREFLSPFEPGPARQFVAAMVWEMPERALPPRPLPCLRHLDRAASAASPAARSLAECLANHGESLHWGQTYSAADFGAAFLEDYGWVEVCGERGHFANDGLAAGFLLLGPNLLYPDHRHVAEEIYIPMTGGTEWRMGGAAFAPREAGELIHHGSNVGHAMRTGREPLLALYLWRGGPLSQKSVIVEGTA